MHVFWGMKKPVQLKIVLLKVSAKNVQKHAKNVLKRENTCKNVQKRTKMCKKCAKTCILNNFGPNSKTCIFKVSAA